MIHGSIMTSGQKGMRKGISLVEMLVAVVLFGIIGSISYTYYKNYYDTSYAAKQLRVYTVVDQAAQLSNAFDLYNTKNGVDPVTVDDLVNDKILTQVPVQQSAMTDGGWRLEQNSTVDTTATGVTFIYDINSSTASAKDKLDYCNILNEVAHSSWELNTTRTDYAGATYKLMSKMYNLGDNNDTSEFEYFHCTEGNTTQLQYIFIKTVDASI